MLKFELATRLSGLAFAAGGKRSWDFEHGDTGLASFERAGAGTAFTVAGLIQQFASGVPRITDKGLLLEGAATNLFTWSDDFSQVVWSGQVTRTGGKPDIYGGTTAVEWMATGAAGVWARSIAGAGRAAGVSVRLIFAASGYGFAAIVRNNTTSTVLNSATFDPATTPSGSTGGWAWRAVGAGYTEAVTTQSTGMSDGDAIAVYYGASSNVPSGRKTTFTAADFFPGPLSSHIITAGAAASRGADSASLTVPPGCTTWQAVYSDARTVASGSGLTPGGAFDLVAGRPWIGLGNELKGVRFAP